MKFSENWLREWLPHKLDVHALAERLTMAGLEVGALERAAPAMNNVVVGKIRTVEPHPKADRLRVCSVEVGRDEPQTIVCGAPNARAGMIVPAALPGAVLPGDKHIARAEIRGVASAGMLCSAAELGLEDDASGLLELDASLKIGQPISEAMQLDDWCVDVDLTPNRGDCLSVAGIARELSALIGVRVKPVAIPNVRASARRRFGVRLDAREDCPRYAGRVIEGVDPTAVTPTWMRERLRRSGQRSISAVVDVTNYVMLELGQPMHAFDLNKLNGGIVVRHAARNERLTLLDGKEIKPQPGTLLIADERKPLALAGVMGGQDSAVGETTRDIFLESAWFRPQAIAGRARSLGLQTESSYRFERGVDPELQRVALERATKLLLEIVGGRAGPVTEVRAAAHLPKRPQIMLRQERARRLLGIDLPPKHIEQILRRLGMAPSATGQGWRVTAPSHRFDMVRECDLIEEIARVNGYENIPTRAPHLIMDMRVPTESHLTARRVRELLVDRDYQEVVTYSFVAPELQRQMNPAHTPVELANPISAELAVMRTNLWPGLVQTALYNQNRQHRRLRLFEIGRVFVPQGKELLQELRLGGLVSGSAVPEQWGTPARPVDFYDLKGDVETLLALAGRAGNYRFRPAAHAALHPAQAAEILDGEQVVGQIGALHPQLQANTGLEQPAFLFELALESLQNGDIPSYQAISRYPAIRRDLAVVVDEDVPAARVLQLVADAAGGTLRKLELFDVYRGKGIDSKRKSLAFGLTLQDSSRTLKDEDIESILTDIIKALEGGVGGELRK